MCRLPFTQLPVSKHSGVFLNTIWCISCSNEAHSSPSQVMIKLWHQCTFAASPAWMKEMPPVLVSGAQLPGAIALFKFVELGNNMPPSQCANKPKRALRVLQRGCHSDSGAVMTTQALEQNPTPRLRCVALRPVVTPPESSAGSRHRRGRSANATTITCDNSSELASRLNNAAPNPPVQVYVSPQSRIQYMSHSPFIQAHTHTCGTDLWFHLLIGTWPLRTTRFSKAKLLYSDLSIIR